MLIQKELTVSQFLYTIRSKFNITPELAKKLYDNYTLTFNVKNKKRVCFS